LISLNASIEASRAGETGRGFAVIAREINKLSELTKKSTKSIDSMLNVIKDNISSASSQIKEAESAVTFQTESIIEKKINMSQLLVI